jgi:hypothetical protein
VGKAFVDNIIGFRFNVDNTSVLDHMGIDNKNRVTGPEPTTTLSHASRISFSSESLLDDFQSQLQMMD